MSVFNNRKEIVFFRRQTGLRPGYAGLIGGVLTKQDVPVQQGVMVVNVILRKEVELTTVGFGP
jgi:hypothetical protein